MHKLNKGHSRLSRLNFEDEELDAVDRLLGQHEFLGEFLSKVITSYEEENRSVELGENNWDIRRAFADGRADTARQLLKLFKEI